MEYLLFVVYLIVFAWLITKVKFFTRSGLTNSQLIIVFLLKVMAAIFYGWIGLYYGGLAQMSDTWMFHYQGLYESNLLLNNPQEYINNLRNPYEGGLTKIFATEGSYWNDLKGNIIIKLVSIFNLLSFGQYYVNVILYTFITLFGTIAFYRVMIDVFPGKKLQVLFAIFLLPSFLYWASGIHKEGLIFLGLMLVIYHVYFGLKNKSWGVARILMMLLGLLIVFILRNFLIIILIPAIIAWLMAERFPKKPFLVYSLCYLVFGILFFTGRYIHQGLDFPKAVVVKQQEFLTHTGGSAVPTTELEPTFRSFMATTPEALVLSAVRPFPSDVKHILSLAAATEINILLLLFIVFLIFRKNGVRSWIFIYFCLFFAFTTLITIGYTVNFLGAIVRYRSIVLPFLIVPMVCLTNWEKIGRAIFPNIMNRNNIA